MGKRVPNMKAVLGALKSPRTPPHLKAGLRRYAKKKGWL